MQLPFVDVIIPHLNDRDRLKECLELLHRQSYPQDCYRITVVDNGSQRPVDDLVAAYPLAAVTVETERGCGSARNRGVASTKGDILAFTDSDCRPDPDWILNAVNWLTHEKCDIVAGDIRVFSADPMRPTDAELYDTVFGFEARRYAERKHFATGANIVVSRRVFDQVGPFRDGHQPEDLEWGRRAHAQGFRIRFAADVVIRHPARRTWAELKRKTERTSWHARNYMSERPWFRLRWLLYTLAMASPPLVKMWQIARTDQLSGPQQRWRTIRTLVRIRYYRTAVMAGYVFEPAPVRAESEAS